MGSKIESITNCLTVFGFGFCNLSYLLFNNNNLACGVYINYVNALAHVMTSKYARNLKTFSRNSLNSNLNYLLVNIRACCICGINFSLF